MVAVEALLPAVLLLLVGILAIVLVRPIKLSPIVGYLIAGLIIGPHAWGLIEESKTTHLLAELGVVFLLFDIGLHFSLPRIWEARRDILGLGPLQVLVCGLAFGGIAVAMGFATEQAVINGKPAVLTTLEGTDENGQTMRQIFGIFEAKNGSGAMVMVMGDEAGWDETAVNQFLASIRDDAGTGR